MKTKDKVKHLLRDVPSLKEPLENRLKVITDIKSVYIAMQRMQQVPDTDLNSFNSNLY